MPEKGWPRGRDQQRPGRACSPELSGCSSGLEPASRSLAHRAAVLETGLLTLAGDSADLLQNPRVQAAYLGA